MNKDFTQEKLNSFPPEKVIKILCDQAYFIEKNPNHQKALAKLAKYHRFLENNPDERIQKLNKEFNKVKQMDYQFQIYLMNLERHLDQSVNDYQFLMDQGDLTQRTTTLPLVCLLDSVRSAHNVGAMFRNAECFGCEKIILTGLSPRGDHPQVLKTAMGTERVIPWEYSQSARARIEEYKQQGYSVWAVEKKQVAIDISQLNSIPPKLVLVFGHEQFGISNELLQISDQVICIEMLGVKNSLNVAVAQGICLQKVVSLR